MSYVLDTTFGCHIAQGRLDRDGYAFHGKTRAHIVAWTAINGPVPEGKVLDHLCRRRNCCAPHHLEPVDQSENEKRKLHRYRVKREKCQRGHDMKLNGVMVPPNGGWVCRTCNRNGALA